MYPLFFWLFSALMIGFAIMVVVQRNPVASALSLPEARRLFELIAKLKGRGVALVFISHFIEDVLAICNRITILKDGRLLKTQAANQLDRA